MIDGAKLMGFLGTTLVIAAYLPQIRHLIKEQCTGGISMRAYCMWLPAALLLLVHAIAIHDPVFFMLQGYQLGACGLIVFFCWKYKGAVCETHRHTRQSLKFESHIRRRIWQPESAAILMVRRRKELESRRGAQAPK